MHKWVHHLKTGVDKGLVSCSIHKCRRWYQTGHQFRPKKLMSSFLKGIAELDDHPQPNSLQLMIKTISWGLTSALSMAHVWIHFMYKETEAQRGEVTQLRSHSGRASHQIQTDSRATSYPLCYFTLKEIETPLGKGEAVEDPKAWRRQKEH